MGCECLQQVAIESTAKLTACSCKSAGFCDRHQCLKTEHWHNLCRTRADYFQAWEEGKGPCVPQTPPSAKTIVLGDVVARCISVLTFGMVKSGEACGCEKRREWLNRFVVWGWWRK